MADRITLSPSRVKRWVRCKRTYYWRYNRKLVRIRKEAPMELGLVVGGALAEYYKLQPDERSFEVLTSTCLGKSVKSNLPKVQGEKSKGREKIVRTSGLLLAHYHDWAIEKDDFDVVMVETSHQVELTPEISLLAIPDANVITPEEMPLILEHKVRYRYRPGDFGIDYQSVASCIVSNAIGTLYNVLEYGKGKYHREPIIRSEQELDYFKDMFIHIGQDILSSPPERMYPMPFKRCSCEYWELCNGEMQGLDLDDIISELYQPSSGRAQEKVMREMEKED